MTEHDRDMRDALIRLMTLVEEIRADIREIKDDQTVRRRECVHRYNDCRDRFVEKGEVRRTATLVSSVVGAVVAGLIWLAKTLFGFS